MSETHAASSETNSNELQKVDLTAFPNELVVKHRQVGKTVAWQLIAILGWICVLFLFVLLQYHWYVSADFYDDGYGVHEVGVSGSPLSENKIAIIKITGVIYDGSGYIKRQIDRVMEDKRVKAVVLRVNSPGGTVTGSDYIYHHLKKMLANKKIPLVVSMGSMATSGGYYVSMAVGDQEDSIIAEPTCTTGSIGVIIPHWNYSQLMESYGVVDDSIMSHPRKRMLTPSKKMPEDHRELLQEYVDESFHEFKKKILAGRSRFRSINKEGVENDASGIRIEYKGRDLATGEIFHAAKALQYGLVDRLGFIEDAIERAAELAELDLVKTRVVNYSRPAPWLEIPFLSKADTSNQLFGALMELNTPRAYFLSSNLRPLFSSWEDPLGKQAE
ncbi:MAG: signal peptide peptidase SppA [Planctomycetota bacterium]|nr:signal peptide peptidase SppA [Planctomycetota bacterium]